HYTALSSVCVPLSRICGTWRFVNLLIFLATPTGFEPVTPRLGIWCSIHLSYGAVFVTELAHLFTRSTSAALTGRLRVFLTWLFAGSEADNEFGAEKASSS